MSVALTFALAGAILILGFLSDYVFKKTGIPDILILLLIGIEIGPVLKLIDSSVLAPLSPVFSALALVIILFDGGLNLDIKKVVQDSPRAILLALLCVFLSMFSIGYFARYVLGWSLLKGFLLGAIIGGTSSSIVIPLIKGISLDEKVSTILSLESAFTDALVVVFGLTLLQFLTFPTEGAELSVIVEEVAGAFSIAIVLGFAIGIIWLRIIKSFRTGKKVYTDIVTLGVVLLFYSLTEMVGGNGAIFALMFGLVLGNGIRISKALGIKKGIEATRFMKRFESEISFFIKTFFFVFLGLIFAVNNLITLLYSLAILALLLFGRYISVLLISFNNKILAPHRDLMTVMMPRGLSAAVLAQIVVSSNIPGTQLFPDMILLTIIYSVLISSVGIFMIKRRRKPIPLKTQGK
jgi:cell volume regulation protein A